MLGLDGDPAIWVRMAPFNLPRFLLSNSVHLRACVCIYIHVKTLVYTQIFMRAWMWKHTRPLPSPCTQSAASPPGGSQAAVSCSVRLWAWGDGHLHHPWLPGTGPCWFSKGNKLLIYRMHKRPCLAWWCGCACMQHCSASGRGGRTDLGECRKACNSNYGIRINCR